MEAFLQIFFEKGFISAEQKARLVQQLDHIHPTNELAQAVLLLLEHKIISREELLWDFFNLSHRYPKIIQGIHQLEARALFATQILGYHDIERLARYDDLECFIDYFDLLHKNHQLRPETYALIMSALDDLTKIIRGIPNFIDAVENIFQRLKKHHFFNHELIQELLMHFHDPVYRVDSAAQSLVGLSENGFLDGKDKMLHFEQWYTQTDKHHLVSMLLSAEPTLFEGPHQSIYLNLVYRASKTPDLLLKLKTIKARGLFDNPFYFRHLKLIHKHANPLSLIDALVFIQEASPAFHITAISFFSQLQEHPDPRNFIEVVYAIENLNLFADASKAEWIEGLLLLKDPLYFWNNLKTYHDDSERLLAFINLITGREELGRCLIFVLGQYQAVIQEQFLFFIIEAMQDNQGLVLFKILFQLQVVGYLNTDNIHSTLMRLLSGDEMEARHQILLILDNSNALSRPVLLSQIGKILMHEQSFLLYQIFEILKNTPLFCPQYIDSSCTLLLELQNLQDYKNTLYRLNRLGCFNSPEESFAIFESIVTQPQLLLMYYVFAKVMSPVSFDETASTAFLMRLVKHGPQFLSDEAIRVTLTMLGQSQSRFSPQQLHPIFDFIDSYRGQDERIKKFMIFYIMQSLLYLHPTFPPVDVVYATPQSTHTASINDTVRASLTRLLSTYGPQLTEALHPVVFGEIRDFVFSRSNHLLKNQAAETAIIRLITEPNAYQYPGTTVNKYLLFLLCYKALMDESMRFSLCSTEEARDLFIEMLYQVQRGYNIDESGHDNGLVDQSLCEEGAFHKCIESLTGVHPDCELIFLSQEMAGNKFLRLVMQHTTQVLDSISKPQTLEAYQHFLGLVLEIKNKENILPVWDMIKIQVVEELLSEYRPLYASSADLTGHDNPKLRALFNLVEDIAIDLTPYENALSAAKPLFQPSGLVELSLLNSKGPDHVPHDDDASNKPGPA